MADETPAAEKDAVRLTADQVGMVTSGRMDGAPVGIVAVVEHLLTQQRDWHLDMHRAYRPEVVAEVAVHLGSHEDWERLAEWTGGRIESSQDPSGEWSSDLVLPNGERGGEWAWLALNHAGEFHFRAEVQAPDVRSSPGQPAHLPTADDQGDGSGVGT